jgi:hypothetical protein
MLSLLRRAPLITACAVLGTVTIAFAQPGPARPAPSAGAISRAPPVDRYYERWFDLPTFLLDWERSGAPGRDGTLGFLAGAFEKRPDQIALVAEIKLARPTQIMVVQSLRLAQKIQDARNLAQKWGWPPEQMAPITPVQPLLAMKPQGAAHFDTFWGASFATGDAKYVRPIYDYYAAVVGEPGIDVRDLTTLVISKSNKGAVQAIVQKYPKEQFSRVAHASSALWSLESNARQHKFVAAAIDQYMKENPEGPATKGFIEHQAAVRAVLSKSPPAPR